jgi:hypothetical protein
MHYLIIESNITSKAEEFVFRFTTDKILKMVSGLLLLIVTSGLPGCDDEPESFRFCPNERKLRLPAACDISTPPCQQAVFRAVQCLHDSPMPIPPIRTISEDEFREELGVSGTASDIAEDTSTDTDSADTDSGEPAIAENYWDASLHLLGLVTPESTTATAWNESQATAVAAYYSTFYRDVTIISHPVPADLVDNMYTLAHEFTHAFQDFEVGLEEQSELYSHDDDILISTANSKEGDATIRGNFALAILFDYSIESLEISKWYGSWLSYVQEDIAENSSPYVPARTSLYYATGPLYVYETFLRSGLDGMNDLRLDFPTSAVYWMAGYDVASQNPDALTEPLQCGKANPADGFKLVHQDTFGAAILYAFLSGTSGSSGLDIASTWRLALQWRGDAIQMFTNPQTNHVAFLWRIRMATPNDIATLATITRNALPQAVILQPGKELLVFMSTDMTMLSPWAASYQCSMTRGN